MNVSAGGKAIVDGRARSERLGELIFTGAPASPKAWRAKRAWARRLFETESEPELVHSTVDALCLAGAHLPGLPEDCMSARDAAPCSRSWPTSSGGCVHAG